MMTCHCEERDPFSSLGTCCAIRLNIVLACLLLALSSGCAGRTEEDKPPDIRYGKDLCAECRMIIGEARFAAAAMGEDGEYLKFDDIGCMRIHQGQAAALTPPKNFWVHDYATEAWVRGAAAFFAKSDSLITPMGYGVAAFSGRSGAEDLAKKQGGKAVSWEEKFEVLQKRVTDTAR